MPLNFLLSSYNVSYRNAFRMPRPKKGEDKGVRSIRLDLRGRQKEMFEELLRESGFTDAKAYVWHLILNEYERMLERRKSREASQSSQEESPQ